MRRKTLAFLAFCMFASVPVARAQDNPPYGPDAGYSTKRVKTQAAIERAPLPADKGMIYVVRPTHFGALVPTRLSMDGQWVGLNKANSYFVFLVDPGQHAFCSQSENASRLSLNVEAGKIYYLQQHVREGWVEARSKLSQMNDDEGKAALAKCQRMLFWPKGKPQPSE